MMYIVFIAVMAVLGYTLFLGWSLWGWMKVVHAAQTPRNEAAPSVTVIIPARNEAATIKELLHDLLLQDYKGVWEVIVVDDHSDDATFEIVGEIARSSQGKMKAIRLEGDGKNSGSKKAAITSGLELATGEWVLLTDADCRVPAGWISSFLPELTSPSRNLIAGTVIAQAGKNFMSRVSALESLGLAVIAASGIARKRPLFCNGANLAFRRSAFKRIGGYGDSISSKGLTGDDTYLMLKFFEESPGSISFSSRSVVLTAGDKKSADFVSRRQRWASKVPGKLSRFTLMMASLAWMAHAGLLFLLAGWLLNCFSKLWFMAPAFVRVVMEIRLLHAAATYYQQKFRPLLIVAAQPFYWIAVVIIGFLAVLFPYRWKGRMGS